MRTVQRVNLFTQFSVRFGTLNVSVMANAKMTKKCKGKKVKTSKIAKEKNSKALCHLCGKSFVKISNVNAHIEKDHKGLRWICHICNAMQVSKHSHLRHFNVQHKGETNINPDANMRYMDDSLPEIAKDATIKHLKERNQVLEVLAKYFRKRLVKKLKENIYLKAKLGLNAESEKVEFNSLIEGERESSESSEDDEADEFNDLIEGERKSSESSEDENDSVPTVSTSYPDNSSQSDSLEHIEESDFGAGGSGL